MSGSAPRAVEDRIEARFDRFLGTVPLSSVRQASGYAAALRKYGHTSELFLRAELGAAAHLAIRSFPIGGARVHSSGGLALARPDDLEQVACFLDELIGRGRELRAAVLDVNLHLPRRRFLASAAEAQPSRETELDAVSPDVVLREPAATINRGPRINQETATDRESIDQGTTAQRRIEIDQGTTAQRRIEIDQGTAIAQTAAIEQLLVRAGFQHVEEQGTYFVRLEAESDEALLERFAPITRRNVRKADKRGVRVELRRDRQAFSSFAAAHREMTSRKKLDDLPPGLIEDVLFTISEQRQGDLFVADFGGIARNYLFLSSIGEPVYHWGASAPESMAEGCPPTGQILHYAAMRHYRRLGKALYDFGGSYGPVPIEGHENYGVWRFKYAFAPEYVAFSGTWRKTLRPLGARLQSGLKAARDWRRARRGPVAGT